nr:glycosyltransferase family 2 protein [Methylobacterium sp. BTF04]
MAATDDPLFTQRLSIAGNPRGCWIVLRYRGHAVPRPLRPLVRLVRTDGRSEEFVLPGPVLGAAFWLGYLPADLAEICLATDPRSGFVLERVGLRGHADVFAECLWKRPLRLVPALYTSLRRDERRFRDILRGACGVTPMHRYARWTLDRMRTETDPATDWPVALILPARRADMLLVMETVRSLEAQSHSAWTLAIAWDQHGADLTPADSRVTQVAWSETATLRDRAPDATAVGMMLPGERLTVDALSLLVGALAGPDAPEMVYGDEVVIAASPLPRFKPDWSPDLALVTAYQGAPTLHAGALLSHLAALPLGRLEGCRTRFALAAATTVQSARVAHVPRVLALVPPPPADAAIDHADALGRHCVATGSLARVRTEIAGFDLLWPLPQPAPLVSVVIPSRNRLDLIRQSSDGVLNGTAYPAIELVIVDNGSTDADVLQYYGTLRRDPRVRILSWPAPFDFSAMTNAGVAAATGRVVVLLNNDIAILHEDWLEALVRQACRPEVGAVGAKLLYADGTLQHAGVVVGLGGRAGHILRRRPAESPGHLGQMRVAHEVSAVTAACLAVEKHKFDAVGGLDAQAFPIDFNDVDFCLRLNAAGYKTLWTPRAVVAHRESTSRGPSVGPARLRFEREADRFVARWRDTIRHDPFYHPALSLTTFGEDLE